MSFKVLVIPEDPKHDRYILMPLVEELFRQLGKPRAKVTVLPRPHLQGYAHVKKHLPDLWPLYKHYEVLLFLPDHDCDVDRHDEARYQEQLASKNGIKFFVCPAIEEVEAWLLAGHIKKLDQHWSVVRQDCEVKERFFAPFLQKYGSQSPGGGRKELMEETLKNWNVLLKLCPELKELQTRLAGIV